MIDEKEIIQFQQLISDWKENNDYTEKSIEFSYYELISTYYKKKYNKKDLIKVKYNSPYSSDGIITIERNKIDYSILIEAKYDKDYTNRKDLVIVLCQAIYYLKRLENEQELLPAVILLVSKNNTAVIRTEEVVGYLFNDYDWDQPANQAFTNVELYGSLYDNNLQASIYNLFTDNINDYLEKIDDYCNKSEFTETKNKTYKLTNELLHYNDYSDNTLAKNFINSSLNNIFYNTIDNNWYEYNGFYWSTISSYVIKNKLLIYLEELLNRLSSKNNSVYYFRLSQKILNTLTLNNIYDLLLIKCSKSIPLNNNIISLNNGDYDLHRRELLPQSKDNYSLSYYNYEYNGDNIELYKIIGRSDLLDNEFLELWFNDTLEPKTASIVLLQDAFNSYNNWAVKRGNSPLSLRYFISNFTNHKTFYNSKANYVSKGTVLKAYKHSLWDNPDNPDEIPRVPNQKDSFFVNLAFK